MAPDPRKLGCKCDQCWLGKYRRREGTFRPVMPENDAPGVQHLALSRSPADNEVLKGRPLAGDAGRMFEAALGEAGFARSDFTITNAILCAPPANNYARMEHDFSAEVKPLEEENKKRRAEGKPLKPVPLHPIVACRPHVLRLLRTHPNVLALGPEAYWTVTGSSHGIFDVRGSFNFRWLVESPTLGLQVVRPHPPMDGEEEWRPGPDGGTLLPPLIPDKLANAKWETVHPLRVLPTLNPAFATRYPAWKLPFTRDVERFHRWLNDDLHWSPIERTHNPTAKKLHDFLYGKAPYTDFEAHGVDIETDGRDEPGRPTRMRCISFATPDEAMVVHFRSVEPGGPTHLGDGNPDEPGFYTEREAGRIRRVIIKWLTDPERIKYGHNFGYFDVSVLIRELDLPVPEHGDECPVKGLRDTILYSRGNFSELKRDLYTIGTTLTDVKNWKTDHDDNKKSTDSKTDKELGDYCMTDSKVTVDVGPQLHLGAQRRKQSEVMDFDHRVQQVARNMTRLGMFVNEPLRKQMEEEKRDQYKKLKDEIGQIVGIPGFNPNSFPQVGQLLYSSKGWDLPALAYSEDTGEPSTDDDSLRGLLHAKVLSPTQEAFIMALRRLRAVAKELSTYIVPLRPWNDLRKNSNGDLVGGLVWPDGRVRPKYNVHCYSPDTEILTERGWVAFPDLRADDRVAQWWEDSGSIDFVKPSDRFVGPYKGPLHLFQSESADLLTTPNHRHPLVDLTGAVPGVHEVTSDTFPSRQGWATLHGGLAHPADREHLPGDAQEHLRGVRWAPTAGGHQSRVEYDGLVYCVTVPSSWVMVRRNGKVTISGNSPKTGRLSSSNPNCFTGETEILTARGWVRFDQLPEGLPVAQWSKDTGEITFAEPTAYHRGHFDGKLVEVQTQSASLRMTPEHRMPLFSAQGEYQRDVRAEDLLGLVGGAHLSHGPGLTSNLRAGDVREVPYRGEVYCVSVPTTYIVVRHNGKVTITGQSQNFPKHLRKLIIPQPGNTFVGADYDQLELRLVSAVAQIAGYLKVFANDGDPHAVTALLIYGDVFRAELQKSLTPDQWEAFLRTGSPVKAGKGKTKYYDKLRNFAKTFVYAVLYGGTASTIYQSVSSAENEDGTLMFPDMREAEVRAAYSAFMRNAKEIPLWWEQTLDFANRHGYVLEPVMGRRRDFPSFERNEILNHPIQGGGAAIAGQGVLRVQRIIPFDFARGTGMFNFCHDAAYLEIPDRDADIARARAALTEGLEGRYDHLPGVVFSAPADKNCYNWAEAA